MNHQIIDIQIPTTIVSSMSDGFLWFKGPLGTINVNLKKLDPYGIAFFQLDPTTNTLQVAINPTHPKSKSMGASITSTFSRVMDGLSRGVFVSLELVGVGFRAQVDPHSVDLKLGHSHPVDYPITEAVRIVQKKPTEIVLYGIDQQQVSQSASEIRDYRPPEPYKGKGVRYKDERISLKIGKKK